MKKILDFLTDLEQNNTRDWFLENKQVYTDARQQMMGFLEQIIPQIALVDPSVTGLMPKNCIFRIYRDVRFSKDKKPYKTNFGASINGGGRKISTPGYYLHIQPGASFIGGGIYMPEPAQLKAIRNEIYFSAKDYKAIINNQEFEKRLKVIEDDRLKLAPKGFPKDFADIELLKNKHYVVLHSISDEQIVSDDLVQYCLGIIEQVHVYNKFLYRALDNAE